LRARRRLLARSIGREVESPRMSASAISAPVRHPRVFCVRHDY